MVPNCPELLQVAHVEHVIAVLEEGHICNSLLVKESEQSDFQRCWQDLK